MLLRPNYVTLFLWLGLSLVFTRTHAQNEFWDLAYPAGIQYSGKTFGATWGDVDGDGFQDLFMSCHTNRADPYFENDLPRFWRNLQGTFMQRLQPYFLITENDWHGNIFFDMENDGDVELLTLTGGKGGNVLLINDGEDMFFNEAPAAGLHQDEARGRTPGLFDLNNDGLIDIVLNNLPNNDGLHPPSIYKNLGGIQFEDVTDPIGLDAVRSIFSIPTDINWNGSKELFILDNSPRILRLDDGVFITAVEFPILGVRDFVMEDFNGDGLMDIFFARAQEVTAVEETVDGGIRAYYEVALISDPIIFDFEATMAPTFRIRPQKKCHEYVLHKGSMDMEILDGPLDIETNGDYAGFQGSQEVPDTLNLPHLFISYDQNDEVWEFKFAPGEDLLCATALEIVSEQPMDLLSTSGIPENPTGSDVLAINQGEDEFQFIPIAMPDGTGHAQSVVAADIDNDMDMDIYVVRSDAHLNRVNTLFLNDGSGQFSLDTSNKRPWGNGPGIGESVTTVDPDNDGDIDLFVTNGKDLLFLEDALPNLYINFGNDNHWLKLVLQGTISNSMGIHARVSLFTDGVEQRRYQTGGTHRFSQNDARIHYGMGSYEVADSIVIDWPSGVKQTLTNVQADQILTVVEPDFELRKEGIDGSETPLLRLFPNPNSGVFRLRASSDIRQLEIRDTYGRLLDSPRMELPSKDVLVNGGHLEPGLYLVQVTFPGGQQESLKMLVER